MSLCTSVLIGHKTDVALLGHTGLSFKEILTIIMNITLLALSQPPVSGSLTPVVCREPSETISCGS